MICNRQILIWNILNSQIPPWYITQFLPLECALHMLTYAVFFSSC